MHAESQSAASLISRKPSDKEQCLPLNINEHAVIDYLVPIIMPRSPVIAYKICIGKGRNGLSLKHIVSLLAGRYRLLMAEKTITGVF